MFVTGPTFISSKRFLHGLFLCQSPKRVTFITTSVCLLERFFGLIGFKCFRVNHRSLNRNYLEETKVLLCPSSLEKFSIIHLEQSDLNGERSFLEFLSFPDLESFQEVFYCMLLYRPHLQIYINIRKKCRV